MKPLVSIIIPVYNGSNYLKEAINSALAQTYENLEIVVVNDGSCDDLRTEQIALSYGKKIRYISKENGGSSSALNTGIRNMRGEYFSWLSHDDLYLPLKIEKQMDVMLRQNPSDTIIVCRGTLIDENGAQMWSKPHDQEGLKEPGCALSLLSHGKGINGCGVLIAKSVLNRVGFFDEEMVYLNDLDYWWRIIFSNVNVFYMCDELVKTRIHSQQVSITKKSRFNIERHYLANKLLKQVDHAQMDLNTALKQVAYFCASENLKDEYILAKKKLLDKKILTSSLNLYLYVIWVYGYLKRMLRWFRKKLLFR